MPYHAAAKHCSSYTPLLAVHCGDHEGDSNGSVNCSRNVSQQVFLPVFLSDTKSLMAILSGTDHVFLGEDGRGKRMYADKEQGELFVRQRISERARDRPFSTSRCTTSELTTSRLPTF